MRRSSVAALLAGLLLAGCEYFGSDVATRIRYRLVGAMSEVAAEGAQKTISVTPDHWPDECPRRTGYRVTLSPYKGNKAVAVGDIVVDCRGGGGYYTGLGSEKLYVARALSVEKKSDEALRITLRRTASGVEIVALD